MSFAADAAGPPMAVVVAPGHARTVAREDLALIYLRKKTFWSDGTRVQAVNLPASSPLRNEFSHAVLGSSLEELDAYWANLYFHGVSPPFVLGSEEAVVRFIAETPGAIGYVSFCKADARVAVVLVITAGGHIADEVSGISCTR
jgi:ABC-type phosphate transport system substrate-binding protein